MSQNRRSQGGWVDGNPNLPRGPNGRALCRWCAKEVPKGRRTFCSGACVDEHMVRTNPQHARSLVGKRDRGVCAICGLDTEYLHETARWLSGLANRHWHFTRDCTGKWPRLSDEYDGAGDERAAGALDNLSRAYYGRSDHDRGSHWYRSSLLIDHLWEADHIVPVIEGGGECGLDGLRTLCLPCHKAETARLRRRLAGYPDRTGAQLPLLAS